MNDTPATPAPGAADNAPTPRTDAFIDDHLARWPLWDWQDNASAYADFARTLERELTSAQAALAAKDREIADFNERINHTGEGNYLVHENAYLIDQKLAIEWACRAVNLPLSEWRSLLPAVEGLRARVADLERQLAEAGKDKERLDWLESKSKFVTSMTGAHRGYHELPSIAIDYWCGKAGVTAGLGMTPATLRAAIDAARRPQP